MGSCTKHFLSVSADSAERPSWSPMQRCKVIPPTRQNSILLYNFRTSSIEDATNDIYGDRVGEDYEGPTIRHPGAAVLVTVLSS
jgi:hypothetical protein